MNGEKLPPHPIAHRGIEVAEDPLEVLGVREELEILGGQPAIACVFEQRSVGEGRPDIDAEAIPAQQRGARVVLCEIRPEFESPVETRCHLEVLSRDPV
jgi:hypothetical protein